MTLRNDAGREVGMDKLDDRGLTAAQREALIQSLTQHVTCIQGPPGTGKTFIAARVVEAWRKILRQPVLAVAESNAAADNLAEALLARGIECVRIGRMARYEYGPAVSLPEYRKLVEARRTGDRGKEVYLRTKLEKTCVERFPVIVCTCIGAGHEALESSEFPCVIIDECTQAVLPSTLVPLMHGAQRVVLIGDHMQLPPTILSKEARDQGYSLSLFEKLVRAHPNWAVMLDVQRRMHPSIASFPSRSFYHDGLRSANCSWDPVPIDDIQWQPGQRVLLVDTEGWEERRGQSSFNKDEANTLLCVVSRVQCSPDEIGIITPYVAQKRLIQDQLPIGYEGIKVDTVDGFQGSERDLILFSCVRSNERGLLGFLSDYRRMNVALTRARRGLIVFGNLATLEAYGEAPRDSYDDRSFWRRWVRWCRQNDLVLKVRDLRI